MAGYEAYNPAAYAAYGAPAYGAPMPAPAAAPPGAYAAGPPAYGAPPPGAAPYGAPAPHPHYGAPYGQPPAAAPPPVAATDEVRTIFITGFPADVKERELNNMLRFMPGYEASQMTWRLGAAQGFALFATPYQARAACDQISQLIFDESSTLRCEMARKNMYIRDMDPSGKRPRTGPGSFTGASSAPGGYAAPGGAPGGGAAAGGAAGAGIRPGPFPAGGGAPGSAGDNPPCNTLFVGNLAETVNEAELHSIFAPHQGFRQLKVVRGRNTTAFVEYDTIENATKVHNTQQGSVLASNTEKGAIRIQYSRNPFGRKRDAAGAPVGGMGMPDNAGAGH